MIRGMYAAEAQIQAEAMAVVVERGHPGSLERLRQDTLGDLTSWEDLSVALIDESPTAEGCSVAGSYRPEPPTLVVAKSMSLRRRNFTALHELGHHLQHTDIDLGNKVFQYSDPDQFEEQSCDAFAARVLLPDVELEQRIDPRGPSAQDVVDIFKSSPTASREACCVWAARHLRGSGAVVLLGSTGVVQFAAPTSFIPPAKRSDQSHTPLIEAALRNPGGGATRDDTFIVYSNGGQSDTMFGQARWFDRDYLVAVLVTDNVPWKSLALPRTPNQQDAYLRWWNCETCDDSFPVTARCDRCREPRCSNGHCGCHAARSAKDKQCKSCFQVLHPARFEPGSDYCRDCA
jgi:hypothetical protein